MRAIYLDYNATTPLAESVLEAMAPFLHGAYGNPSSAHFLGREARDAVETARERVAALLGTRASDLVFTASGTEANNSALYAWLAHAPEHKHLVVSAVEHSSVRNFCAAHEARGYRITEVPVDGEGRLNSLDVAEALQPDTAFAAIMWANNETGVVHPIAEVAAVCAERGVPLHVDAVQAAGKMPLRLRDLPVDSAAIAGHKMYAPKGAAALYLRHGRRFRPLLWGGAQEHHRRAGTENVAGIVGLGAAADLVGRELDGERERQAALRDRFEARLREAAPDAVVHGTGAPRLPNTSSFHVLNIEAEAMVRMLSERGVCVATGAACESGTGEASHVMKAMGLDKAESHGALRVSVGRDTVQADLDRVCEALPAIVEALRHILPAEPAGPGRAAVR